MDKKTDIVSAQVVDVKSNKITLKTEDDEVIEVARPDSVAHDMLFIQTMKDILKSGIWIPVNKKLKQLLRYDWLETPVEQYSF
ncbi:hypothetical protein [Ligilactobacillus animalis]|uniref:hypothetical protein n=1 Tax=Ligilactobacillus animalis TaxID=1605 RepID=UPI001C102CCA|nr:hypothetical protein [Ligilactobacillus animalis]MBU5279348.1 hypothetical protein [Ligilactobacillus animalis]WKB72599.1 hypothetical protein QYH52_09050 [Ligilactobacillus animalis]